VVLVELSAGGEKFEVQVLGILVATLSELVAFLAIRRVTLTSVRHPARDALAAKAAGSIVDGHTTP
jgi:hypothetical protein